MILALNNPKRNQTDNCFLCGIFHQFYSIYNNYAYEGRVFQSNCLDVYKRMPGRWEHRIRRLHLHLIGRTPTKKGSLRCNTNMHVVVKLQFPIFAITPRSTLNRSYRISLGSNLLVKLVCLKVIYIR